MPGSGSILTPTVVNVTSGVGGVLLAAANTSRMAVIIRNLGDDTGQDVFIGGVGVTTLIGTPLDSGPATGQRGDSLTIPGTCEVRAIVAAGSQAVSVLVVAD